MTSDRPRYVVDASVATKWHLRDEQDIDVADALLTDFREGRVRLVAPDHIRYEVASAIKNAIRQQRLSVTDGMGAVSRFPRWGIPTVADDSLIEAAVVTSLRFRCSLYAGLYLVLAEASDCPLIYADQRLRNTLGARFPLALWVSDYVPLA